MGLFDAAKDTITNLATTEVVKERLAFAMEQAAVLEKKAAELEKTNAVLQFQLQESERQRKEQADKLQGLYEMLEETVRLTAGIEFRRGPRTGDSWQPFCPVCHMPVVEEVVGPGRSAFACSSGKCSWFTDVSPDMLPRIMSELTG